MSRLFLCAPFYSEPRAQDLSATRLAPGTLGCAARHDSYSCQYEGLMLRYLVQGEYVRKREDKRMRKRAMIETGLRRVDYHSIVDMSPASNEVEAFHPISDKRERSTAYLRTKCRVLKTRVWIECGGRKTRTAGRLCSGLQQTR
jgi:hypothetical protein